MYAWKGILVALGQAFDSNAIDDLLFLSVVDQQPLALSGDGVRKFSGLIGAGLAELNLVMQNGPLLLYEIGLTPKGQLFVDAWRSGNRDKVSEALTDTAGSGLPRIHRRRA